MGGKEGVKRAEQEYQTQGFGGTKIQVLELGVKHLNFGATYLSFGAVCVF